jgi:MoxR-like ATPase
MENTQSTCWDDLDLVAKAGINRVLLYGPSGTGKTFAGLHFGSPSSAYRVICTEDLSSADLTGSWMPTASGAFEFLLGPAILAWMGADGKGGRLVVDEVDASGDALSQLLAMTDSPESAKWRNPATGETLRPGPDFSVVMTTNVEDPDDIPPALRDRFPVAINVDRPPLAAVERLSEDLQATALHGRGDTRVPLRALYAFDALRKHHDDETAARLVFGANGERFSDALRIGNCDR